MDVNIGHLVVSSTESGRALDLLVFEEDTYLVLSASTEIRETIEHPIHLFTALHEQEPAKVGSIFEKKGTPSRLLVVVLDLAAEPPTNEDVIRDALVQVFARAKVLGAQSIGLQLLGAQHRVLPIAVALRVLFEVLEKRPLDRVSRIELLVPEGRQEEVDTFLPTFLRPEVRAKGEGEA